MVVVQWSSFRLKLEHISRGGHEELSERNLVRHHQAHAWNVHVHWTQCHDLLDIRLTRQQWFRGGAGLLAVILLSGAAGWQLRATRPESDSADAVVGAVKSTGPRIVCLLDSELGTEEDLDICGYAYAEDGIKLDQSLVGTKVHVVRLKHQRKAGAPIFLISKP